MNLKVEASDGEIVGVVHDRLREAIITGHLKPGSELSQVQVAADLGVSRTPLREALRLLEREGLVESHPNKRVRIVDFSAQDMEQIYTMRITLEALAVRLSVERATDEDLAALEGEMTQMTFFAQRHDYDRYRVPHRAFHDRLVAHAGPRLTNELRELSDHGERYRYLHTTMALQAWEKAQTEHREILDAVIARDPNLAALRLAEHLTHTVLGNLPLLDADYEPTQLMTALELIRRSAS